MTATASWGLAPRLLAATLAVVLVAAATAWAVPLATMWSWKMPGPIATATAHAVAAATRTTARVAASSRGARPHDAVAVIVQRPFDSPRREPFARTSDQPDRHRACGAGGRRARPPGARRRPNPRPRPHRSA